MLKDLMGLMFGDRVFGDNSGVYLRCGYRHVTKKIGEADSIERHVSLKNQLRDMGCWGCEKHGHYCHGPRMEVIENERG